MNVVPVDAHAHIGVQIAPFELTALVAFVMAVTRSLDEAEETLRRRDAMTVWGVGCHPGVPAAIGGFDRHRFATILKRSAFVGEVGLDRRSPVPMERQIEVLSQVLEVVGETPRAVSLHSTGATRLILDLLEQHPVAFPILHWWRGTPTETARAMKLGCLFSLNGHEARSPKVIDLIPIDRVLTETDFPHSRRYDRAASQPAAVATIERALAVRHALEASAMRDDIWANLVPALDAMPDGLASDELRARVEAARARRAERLVESTATQLCLDLPAAEPDHVERELEEQKHNTNDRDATEEHGDLTAPEEPACNRQPDNGKPTAPHDGRFES
jgi:TatD DNase family protein